MSSSPSVPYKAYQPRRQRTANRDRNGAPEAEDVEAVNSFEQAQGFMSPPSPPRPSPPVIPTRASSNKSLPPPPPDNARSSSAHLHPFVSSVPNNVDIPQTLTPLRAHYLKKTLVNLQISHELRLITDPVLGANALGLLGDPFVISDAAKKDALARLSDTARKERVSDLPLMRFLFHQFLLPFPFLATAPPTFWSAKVQPFLSSFLSSTGVQRPNLTPEQMAAEEMLMGKEERREAEERKKLWAKIEKHLALMVAVGIKLTNGEEVVRLGQADLRRLEEVQEERKRKAAEKAVVQGEQSDMVFDVNVVGIRLVSEKGRVRSRNHEVGLSRTRDGVVEPFGASVDGQEFIIRIRRTGVSDVFVSRRYGDFKRLAEEVS